MPDPRATPAMQQYTRFKAKNPDAVLLFRIGDFYEMFDEDAVKVSKAIGLTLTQRTEGIPMAGMPFHQLDTYLRRLINAGFRVAVCEQIEEATSKSAKDRGIVARAITRVITPGTLVDEGLLEHDSPQCLAAVLFTESGDAGAAALSIIDVSTGSFLLFDGSFDYLRDELARRGVRELLYPEQSDGKTPTRIKNLVDSLGISATPRPPWQFRPDEAVRTLCEHFGVKGLGGFGLDENDIALSPAAAVLAYVKQTQTTTNDEAIRNAPVHTAPSLGHIQPPKREDPTGRCVIDAVTLRSLEIEKTLRAGQTEGSLLGVFLACGSGHTPMGKRLLRDWLVRPLCDSSQIAIRHQAVATFVNEPRLASEVERCLTKIQDVSRIAGRVSLRRATPRDVVALAKSVLAGQELEAVLEGTQSLGAFRATLSQTASQLVPLANEIVRLCVEEPPQHLREGGLVRDGVDAELDEARLLQRDANAFLAAYQERLITQYNLPNLKVGFNKITGYYIELPTAQSRNAPPELKRMQTLKNAERYTTGELRDFENKVMSAEARGLERERQIFESLCEKAVTVAQTCSTFSDCIASIDCLAGFAHAARKLNWRKPEIVEEPVLKIEQGRHPVLDQSLGSTFVPNDCTLGVAALDSQSSASLALITGPNMAGKSTYIRMVALITLLAHAGSFVPADAATIGLTDRIFTRVGADDALHSGQSTFMVEMTETANIVNHASNKSLVILDEIGRGTSTLDGLSLAWAVAEMLSGETSSTRIITPRTLFATHYHEITDLEERLPGRVKNLHVAVREWGDQIVFIHRILAGRTDQSYGIHVAKLAGIPASVIARAREVLSSLQVTHSMDGSMDGTNNAKTKPDTSRIPTKKETEQLSLFKEFIPHPAVDSLRELKIDAMSPLQAFDALRKLHTIVVDN